MSTDSDNSFVWPYEFTCTVVTDGVIIPNNYSFKLSIEPILPIDSNVGLGFQKLRHFASDYLDNSVFINGENPLVPALSNLKTNLFLLPCEPYDFYVGSILLSKFLAITEKYFYINHLTIDSAIGDRIQYTVWDPCDSGLDLSGEHWWNQDSVNTNPDSTTTWKDLNFKEGEFKPMVVKGGLSENR